MATINSTKTDDVSIDMGAPELISAFSPLVYDVSNIINPFPYLAYGFTDTSNYLFVAGRENGSGTGVFLNGAVPSDIVPPGYDGNSLWFPISDSMTGTIDYSFSEVSFNFADAEFEGPTLTPTKTIVATPEMGIAAYIGLNMNSSTSLFAQKFSGGFGCLMQRTGDAETTNIVMTLDSQVFNSFDDSDFTLPSDIMVPICVGSDGFNYTLIADPSVFGPSGPVIKWEPSPYSEGGPYSANNTIFDSVTLSNSDDNTIFQDAWSVGTYWLIANGNEWCITPFSLIDVDNKTIGMFVFSADFTQYTRVTLTNFAIPDLTDGIGFKDINGNYWIIGVDN